MKKTLLYLALLGSLPTAALAQKPTQPAPTAAELEDFFDRLEAGTMGEDSVFDSLTIMERRLVTYLKTHEVTTYNLGVGLSAESADAAQLKVFTYSYSSGGTRGTVHQPVLQWRNAAGQHFAYALPDACEFTAVCKLASPGRTRYLLLGEEEGDMNTTTSEALVVELKGNYLLLDKEVFGKNSPLVLGNVELSFDEHRQLLAIDLANHDACEEDDKLLAAWGYRGKFPARPFTMFMRTYPPSEPHKSTAAKTLKLKFNGTHFVKSK